MAEPVILKCPNCASPIQVEDWDRDSGVVKCSYCRALSTIPGHQSAGQQARGRQDEDRFRPRGNIPQPPGLKFEETPGGVKMSRRWFTAVVFFLIPFCIAWNGFLIFWYTIAFTTNSPWIMKVFPIVHVAVGVGLAYFCLAILLNSTTVALTGGLIRVRHFPVPWKGNLDLNTVNVEQLYTKVNRKNRKNGVSENYEVWAVLRDGKSEKVIGLTELTRDEALFIEQRLERALGIEDKPVPGEVDR